MERQKFNVKNTTKALKFKDGEMLILLPYKEIILIKW